MKTLAQFKHENNCSTIQLIKGKDRQFCTIGNNDVVVSKTTDFTKTLFVIPLSKFNNGIDATGGSTIIPNAFIIINSTAVLGDII